MKKKYITKWGEFCQAIYGNDKFTEAEKKELIDKTEAVITDAMKEAQSKIKNEFLKLYK